MKKLLYHTLGTYLNLLAWVAPRQAGRAGFHLFCTPQRPRLQTHQRAFLESARHHCVEVDGTPVQLYQWGEGSRPVLFLHGWQSHSYRWKHYIEALDPQVYRIYSIDAPAHGLSGGRYLHLPRYEKAIEAVLAHIGSVDTLVGHSLGSFAALYAFYKNPLLPVRKVVVTGMPGEVEEFITYYRGVLGLSDRAMRTIYRHFIITIQQHPRYFSALRFAESMRIPGLIIHDEQDREAPYHHAKAVQTVWPGAQLLTTRGLGHNLRSKEVVKAVVDYIEQPAGIPAPFLS